MEAHDQPVKSDPAVDASATNAASTSSTSSIVSAASGAFRWLTSTASTLGHAVEDALKDDELEAEAARRAQQDAEQEENAIDAMAVELTSESSKANGVFTPSKLNYAITPVLLEFATALAEYESTFLHFPRGHQTFTLTRTQEAHARALLASCEPIARLRFRLVPRQMKESEFWRIYFTLMRQVARKVARTDGESTGNNSVAASPASTSAALSNTSVPSTPAPLSSSAAAVATSPSTTAVASPEFSPASSIATPLRSTLDYDEIDRLCGTKNLHGRRISMGLDDDASDDESDTQTDAVIAEIVRRHRSASGSFDPIPSPSAAAALHKTPQHGSKQQRQDSSDFATPSAHNASTDFGVTDAELDAAFEEARLEEEQAAFAQNASPDQLP